jgi:hypothetical protein
MSISSVESENTRNTTLPEIPTTIVPPGICDIVNRINDEGSRSMLLSSVFCHLQQIESCFLENEQWLCAITSAMSEIQFMQDTQPTEPPEELSIPKDLAQQLIDCKHICPALGYSFANVQSRLLQLLPFRRLQDSSRKIISSFNSGSAENTPCSTRLYLPNHLSHRSSSRHGHKARGAPKKRHLDPYSIPEMRFSQRRLAEKCQRHPSRLLRSIDAGKKTRYFSILHQ